MVGMISHTDEKPWGSSLMLGQVRQIDPETLKALRNGEGTPDALADYKQFTQDGGVYMFKAGSLKPIDPADLPADMKARLAEMKAIADKLAPAQEGAPQSPIAQAILAGDSAQYLAALEADWDTRNLHTVFEVDGTAVAALDHDGTLIQRPGFDGREMWDAWHRIKQAVNPEAGEAPKMWSDMKDEAADLLSGKLEDIIGAPVTATSYAEGEGPSKIELRAAMFPNLTPEQIEEQFVNGAASLAESKLPKDQAAEFVNAVMAADIESLDILDFMR